MAERKPIGGPVGFVRKVLGSGPKFTIPRIEGNPAPRRSPSGYSRPGVNFDRGGVGAARRQTYGDPASATADAMAQIAAFYDSEIAKVGSGGGGGYDRAGYQAAINDALELLGDVKGNREALKGVYSGYSEFIDPLSQEAIAAAAEIVGKGRPELAAIAAESQAGIAGGFDSAEAAIAEAAALIGAGDAAQASVSEDAISGEALRLAAAAEEAASADTLLGLSGEAARTSAVAGSSLDENEMTRRAFLLDMEFGQMEEAAQAQLDNARRAAAAAAARASAAARQRRSALSALQDEKAKAMRLNPHEAGEATALTYLQGATSGMDYNRQQLILSTISNAISTQVPSVSVGKWARDQGIALNKTELNTVRNGLKAYTTGMRFQQTQDAGGPPGRRGVSRRGGYGRR